MPRETLSSAPLAVVVGLIENDRGAVLVNRRREGTHMAGAWEFPGGKRKPAEPALAALQRELDEELGIAVIEARRFLELAHEYPDRSVVLDVWLVERFSGVPRPVEAQELRWASLEELATLDLLAADAPIVSALRARRVSSA